MRLVIDIANGDDEAPPAIEITPPPNGTMELVRDSLAGIRSNTAQPPGWWTYYGAEMGTRLIRGYSAVVELLTSLEAAGVGSGREVTVRFTA